MTPHEWCFRYRAGRVLNVYGVDDDGLSYLQTPYAVMSDVREFKTLQKAEAYAQELKAKGYAVGVQFGILQWSDGETIAAIADEVAKTNARLV